MKHLNDTTATIATAITSGSWFVTFAQIYTPVINFYIGILGIATGILACVYWVKKIKHIDGKGF